VLRFVALEGGGEAFTAMQANYVQVVSGDASEAHCCTPGRQGAGAGGAVRTAPAGRAGHVPTAREQGYDLVWPLIRGVWMGPNGCRSRLPALGRSFRPHAMATPEFAQPAREAGLYPFSLTGRP
jgi:putative tricarboxylic transport membrane protein